MAKERMVNTKFWDDSYIINLDPTEKLLYLYFLTSPLTNICGIYEIPLRRVNFDTGIEEKVIQKIIDRFTKDQKIFYIDGWIAIRNFIKHQRNNPKVKRGIILALKLVPESVRNKVSIDYDSLSHSNSNSNLNSNSNTKPKDPSPKPPEKQFSYLRSIPEKDIAEMTEKYGWIKDEIVGKGEDLALYCESKGKEYKNYRSFLIKALKSDSTKKGTLSVKGKYAHLKS